MRTGENPMRTGEKPMRGGEKPMRGGEKPMRGGEKSGAAMALRRSAHNPPTRRTIDHLNIWGINPARGPGTCQGLRTRGVVIQPLWMIIMNTKEIRGGKCMINN